MGLNPPVKKKTTRVYFCRNQKVYRIYWIRNHFINKYMSLAFLVVIQLRCLGIALGLNPFIVFVFRPESLVLQISQLQQFCFLNGFVYILLRLEFIN